MELTPKAARQQGDRTTQATRKRVARPAEERQGVVVSTNTSIHSLGGGNGVRPDPATDRARLLQSFETALEAAGLSPATIRLYGHGVRRLYAHLDRMGLDAALSGVSAEHLREWLNAERRARGVARDHRGAPQGGTSLLAFPGRRRRDHGGRGGSPAGAQGAGQGGAGAHA